MPPNTGTTSCGEPVTSKTGDHADGLTSMRARFAGHPDQVREARRFLAGILDGCPAADEAIWVLSELAGNSVLHSASRDRGTFTVTAEVCQGCHVRIEVRDDGGPWDYHAHGDCRPYR